MIFRQAPRNHAGLLAALLFLLGSATALFAQVKDLPPKPDRYITDKAGVLDAGTLEAINSELEQFERDTSNQFVVAIYPSLPPDAELYQYCTYAAESWKIGQPGKYNGVVLFIFSNDHKMYFAVARGLEGVLPDAICKNIISQQIAPRFKQGDYAGGIQAGVDAAISASKGEYKGNGSTANDQSDSQQIPTWVIILIVIVVIFMISRGGGGFGGPVIYTSGGWGGGGGYSGGGGGGGFSSGGGGGFAGGGAGGSW